MNLEQCIVREIEKNKSISFARFMELALYAPELGYYEQKERVGRTGDFFTSVSVGPLFGELLAFQFAEWLAETGSVPQILESGAHDGQLAFDVLSTLQRVAPDVFSKVHYCILEPSLAHQQWQRETMKGFSNVRWLSEWAEIEAFSGVIFSNELLDAIPFRRIRWNAQTKAWDEMKVGRDGRQFIWVPEVIPNPVPGLPNIPDSLAKILPDGFQTEISPGATAWWKSASSKLQRGRLMAIDYGLTEEEYFSPERSRGTARAYKKHHLVEDLLSDVGAQDITSHVNFSAIIRAGESVGLETEFFGSQAKFLTTIVEKKLRSGVDVVDRKFVAQFQTLSHPAHLGTKFKVLVQKQIP